MKFNNLVKLKPNVILIVKLWMLITLSLDLITYSKSYSVSNTFLKSTFNTDAPNNHHQHHSSIPIKSNVKKGPTTKGAMPLNIGGRGGTGKSCFIKLLNAEADEVNIKYIY